jgi:hypothetical protein
MEKWVTEQYQWIVIAHSAAPVKARRHPTVFIIRHPAIANLHDQNTVSISVDWLLVVTDPYLEHVQIIPFPLSSLLSKGRSVVNYTSNRAV